MADELKTIAATLQGAIEVAKSISRNCVEITVSDAQLIADNFMLDAVEENSDLREELAAANEINTGLENDLTDLRGATSDATKGVTEVTGDIAKHIAGLETALVEVTENCDGQIKRVQKRDDTIDGLEKQLDELRIATAEDRTGDCCATPVRWRISPGYW